MLLLCVRYHPVLCCPCIAAHARGTATVMSMCGCGLSSAEQQASLSVLSVLCSPSSWPSATISLPSSLSQAGTIYRAQLLLTPQWGGCEEFWQLQPSGRQTGAACNGISVGEPYREVRRCAFDAFAGLYMCQVTLSEAGWWS
jgi:hypothetical protein